MFSVMVVDDNEMVCNGIRDYIDWPSLDLSLVAVCENGQEGYDVARRLKPDIVIVDMDMPIMNGPQMASKLKDEFEEMDFIFISCFDDFNYVRKAVEIKAFEYVLKPIIFTELINSIQLLCKEKSKKIWLNKQVEAHSIAQKERFLKDLTYGCPVSTDEMSIQMSNLGIDTEGKKALVAYVQIEGYGESSRPENGTLTYAEVERVGQELSDTQLFHCQTHWAEPNDLGICYILLLTEDVLNTLEGDLFAAREHVFASSGLTIIIGVSCPSGSLLQLPEMYKKARQVIKQSFYAMSKGVFFDSVTHQPFAPVNVDLVELKNNVKEALSSGRTELLGRYYTPDPMEIGEMNESELRTLTLIIINDIRAELVERGLQSKYTLEDETAILETLFQYRTATNIKVWVYELLTEAINDIKKQDNNRYAIIVEDIKQIIKTEYSSLKNVEQIVKSLYISASHANLIFKRQTGVSISDYLTKTRMVEAKKMLLDPYCKIYEVSDRVGYRNRTYFNATFKAFTGLTPKQYRDQVKKTKPSQSEED